MPTNITDADIFTATVVAPADTEPATAASVIQPVQDLADRTRWLKNKVDGIESSVVEVVQLSGSGSWAVPSDLTAVTAIVVGDGGGGSGGRGGRGGSGGGSGYIVEVTYRASELTSPVSYGIGQGGAGGDGLATGEAAVSGADGNGSFFGDAIAPGGKGGFAGVSGDGYSGGGMGCEESAEGRRGGDGGRRGGNGFAANTVPTNGVVGSGQWGFQWGRGKAGGQGGDQLTPGQGGGGGGGGAGGFLSDTQFAADGARPGSPAIFQSAANGGDGGIGYGAGGGGGGGRSGVGELGGDGGKGAPGTIVLITYRLTT